MPKRFFFKSLASLASSNLMVSITCSFQRLVVLLLLSFSYGETDCEATLICRPSWTFGNDVRNTSLNPLYPSQPCWDVVDTGQISGLLRGQYYPIWQTWKVPRQTTSPKQGTIMLRVLTIAILLKVPMSNFYYWPSTACSVCTSNVLLQFENMTGIGQWNLFLSKVEHLEDCANTSWTNR